MRVNKRLGSFIAQMFIESDTLFEILYCNPDMIEFCSAFKRFAKHCRLSYRHPCQHRRRDWEKVVLVKAGQTRLTWEIPKLPRRRRMTHHLQGNQRASSFQGERGNADPPAGWRDLLEF